MSLGRTVVSAVSWSAAIKIGFQLITWAMTLAVIRILTPGDYGLVAITQVFVNIMSGFADFGLGDALVQREDAPRPVAAAVFGTILLLSAALTVLLALAAYPIAGWYHDPRLVQLTQVASLGFLLNGLMSLPRIHLTKSLRIRPLFVMELSAGLIGSIAVIVLAYAGYGAWSLMLGNLAGNVVRLVGFAILTREYYVWPSLDLTLVRPLFSFGAYRTLSFLAWVGYSSADTLILGRWLGAAELGLYTVAMNFACIPLAKIAPVINTVAFPAFAMVQGRPAEGRYYAMKAMRLMAVVSVPVFFGISALAPEVVDLVFGAKWQAAKPILAVLSLAMTFRALLLIVPNYLEGIGDARASFWCTVFGAVLFPPAFLIGCHWGVEGVCYAWLLGYPVMFAVNAWIAARRGRLQLAALLAAPLRPAAAGLAMLAAVATVRACLPPDLPEVLRAAILVAVGAVSYGAVMIVVFRKLALEVVTLFYRGRPEAA
nr:lipopolysaccharide biosynthesis protein [uncultured Rhodopila sp.]